MNESLLAILRMSWAPVATFFGGAVAVTNFEVDPKLIYPIFCALVVALWRCATFVKGVQASIEEARKDRLETAADLSKIYHKINKQSVSLAHLQAMCPACRVKSIPQQRIEG